MYEERLEILHRQIVQLNKDTAAKDIIIANLREQQASTQHQIDEWQRHIHQQLCHANLQQENQLKAEEKQPQDPHKETQAPRLKRKRLESSQARQGNVKESRIVNMSSVKDNKFSNLDENKSHEHGLSVEHHDDSLVKLLIEEDSSMSYEEKLHLLHMCHDTSNIQDIPMMGEIIEKLAKEKGMKQFRLFYSCCLLFIVNSFCNSLLLSCSFCRFAHVSGRSCEELQLSFE